MATKQRVCVIGAGPCGISALCQWSNLKAEGLDLPDVVCYEKQKSVGGQWNFSWRTGTDENGELVHSSVYRHMRTNTPKETMEFSDYSFHQHFGHPTPSYLPSPMIRDYLYGRLVNKPGDLMQYIQFNTAVKWVTYDDATDTFTVTSRNYDTDIVTSSTFSHVLVATSIRDIPHYPNYPGFQTFPGRILHSHDFKDGKQYRGQRVLLIGARFSAEDIALHLHKYGASHVIISHRDHPTALKYPNTVEERPKVEWVDNRSVHFSDGSTAEVDTIILTTGYVYDFPFMEDALRFSCTLKLYPELWKLTLCMKGGNNKLFYPGVWDGVIGFIIYDAQARWIWKVIIGAIRVPDKEAMLADIASWLDKIEKMHPINPHLKQIVEFQSGYMDEFCDASGYEHISRKTDPIMCIAVDARWSDLPTYKDAAYTSPLTGVTALKPTKPWMDDIDDEVEELCSEYIKYKATC